MEEESLLKQPADRRLGDNNTLPPGPPGAEFDTEEFALKSAPPTAAVTKTNENTSIERSSRRRSPTGSPPPRKRRSKSRGRRSPSPPRNRSNRNRRSPSPMRRNRYREYTPDRRRYGRRSPDRRRYGSRGMGRDRYRGRGRSSSRSLSRSATPPTRRGGRWSPKKKPSSPPPPQPAGLVQPPPISNQPPPPPYGVMAPQMYGDAYGAAAGYSQYGVPPPQPGFAQPSDAYATTGFNAAYPPPGTWGVDAYGQQQWMPPPTQIRQMPPPQQQTQPPTSPVGVAPAPSNPTVATNVPPPVAMTKSVHVLPDAAPGTIEANPQHDAVAQEAENQRDEIRKQRTSYLKKTAVLKKELKMLKEQRKDLHSGKAPASPTTKGFIDENEKLQSQIQKKLNTIENVIDMLTGIIGEDNLDKDDEPADDGDVPPSAKDVASTKSSASSGAVLRTAERLSTPSEKKTQSSSSSSDESSSDSSSSSSESSSSSDNETTNKPDNDDDSSPERLKKKVIESMRNKERETSRNKPVDVKIPTKKERFNYVFYDPEMHWCQTCNIFPKTAKDYLNHLHSKDHMDRESIETPWHADMVSDQFPTYENVPTKRTPIRGLTFFVPATSWFCKLCNIWMGDLHCASTHLKSQLHANKYNSFLEENPHYEVNWLADRQKVLNDQKLNPLPQQITSVSTTAAERKKSKKDDEKAGKKRKRKSDKKQKKKKKKSNKKRKKGDSESSSSSSSNSSSSSDTDEPKKKKMQNIEIKDLDNPNPAVSIRLSMRKQENVKLDDAEVPQAPPPPQLKIAGKNEQMHQPPAGGKWTVVQEGVKQKTTDGEDDGIMQEWNTVQPVISESEKKLLEQLKGKLKSKSSSDQLPAGNISNSSVTAAHSGKNELEKENRGRGDRYDRRDIRDNRDNRDRRTSRRRTVSRSPTRSRSRGRDYRRHMRRSRTRSRGRMSPRGGWRGRRRHDRSRSRSLRRRSRSIDRRRRSTRSRSPSRGRVEKPIVRQPEFRPRVPEKDKEKEKKSSENKEKKEKAKLKAPPASSSASNNNSGKKLPFIGKMPVFKKQASGQLSEAEKQLGEQQLAAGYMYPMDASAYTTTQQRPPAPTAAQIQMAMMEDAYGNAPPFHPDAGMMVDYDDLMPDPVQFVNIMGQAPPPPPPQASDEKDMLPPGIDEEESEEFMPKPITEAPPPPPPGKGVLPKDLEDALNIIFPGDKKPGDDGDKAKATKGETQIIDDDPKFEPEELAKDGIHLVTLEETSQLGLDEASQMSMNEPLVFNRPAATTTLLLAADMDIEDSNSRNTMEPSIEQTAPPPSQTVTCVTAESAENSKEASALIINSKKPIEENSDNLKHSDTNEETILITMPESIPIPVSKPIEESMPTVPENIPTPTAMESEPQLTMADKSCELQISAKDEANNLETIAEIDLADIPQPPPSPTESEKNRRQEELDDLAMLGIDADDMAAQCM